MSNFYPCEFTDDNEFNESRKQIRFQNVEQYFMYYKAKMFDTAAIPSILKQTDPKTIQQLGRTINNFNDKVWDDHKLGIMYRGLQLKFGQNPAIRDKLLETENKTLYEANKYDRYWGIGCDVETGIRIENGEEILKNGIPIKFGANNLGELLMELRDTFRVNTSNNSQSYRS